MVWPLLKMWSVAWASQHRDMAWDMRTEKSRHGLWMWLLAVLENAGGNSTWVSDLQRKGQPLHRDSFTSRCRGTCLVTASKPWPWSSVTKKGKMILWLFHGSHPNRRRWLGIGYLSLGICDCKWNIMEHNLPFNSLTTSVLDLTDNILSEPFPCVLY